MKYLVLLIVVFVVLWWLRGGLRRRAQAEAPREAPPPRPATGAQPMVTCAHCGVHLPQHESVQGAAAAYCSEAHRLAHGDAAPPR